MSHSSGAIRFDDGTIRFYEYDGTANIVLSPHYATIQEVSDNWRKGESKDCTCGREEPVSIFTSYGSGMYFSGKACRHCSSVDADYHDDGWGFPVSQDDQTWAEELGDWSLINVNMLPDLKTDELVRQRREFEAAWHQFVGLATKQIEPKIFTWPEGKLPDNAMFFRVEVNHDDCAEKESFLKSLQELVNSQPIEFKFFLPHLKFETYAEAFEYMRTGKLKEPTKPS